MDHFIISGLLGWLLIKSGLIKWELNWQVLLWVSLFGIMPDLVSYILAPFTMELLPGANAHLHRHNLSHSLAGVMAMAMTVWFVVYVFAILGERNFDDCLRGFGISGANIRAYSENRAMVDVFLVLLVIFSLHLVVDMLTWGWGVPLLYPFSADNYKIEDGGIIIRSPEVVAEIAAQQGNSNWLREALLNFLWVGGGFNIAGWLLLLLYSAMFIPLVALPIKTVLTVIVIGGTVWVVVRQL